MTVPSGWPVPSIRASAGVCLPRPSCIWSTFERAEVGVSRCPSCAGGVGQVFGQGGVTLLEERHHLIREKVATEVRSCLFWAKGLSAVFVGAQDLKEHRLLSKFVQRILPCRG